MKNLINKLLILFALIIELTISSELYAREKIMSSLSVKGNDLTVNNRFFAFIDQLYSNTTINTVSSGDWSPPSAIPSSISNNWDFIKTNARVKLEILENAGLCLPDNFTLTIGVELKKYNYQGVYETLPGIKYLTVYYTKNKGSQYKASDYFQVENLYLLSAKIVSISDPNLKSYVQISSEMNWEEIRKPEFFPSLATSNSIPKLTVTKINNGDDINVHYEINNQDLSEWADSVEIQWAYIDNEQIVYDDGNNEFVSLFGSNLNYNFSNNINVVLPYSSSLSINNYKITNVFDQGYLIFRSRVIGNIVIKETINGVEQIKEIRRVEGDWSIAEDGNTSSHLTNAGALNSYIVQVNKFQPKFNWQYNCTYAEDGKKKELISYFDGTLKNRQTVTKSNTAEFAVVKETVYDFQGRPAIEVLPAPTLPNTLKYFSNFNKNASGNGKPYSAANFDYNSSECTTNTEGMSNSSGATKYYSNQNDWLAGAGLNSFHHFIPMSGNSSFYPFVQTEYTPDNTGRVRKQTQAGESFKLGSGRETVNYYGKPVQEELDRLFGEDIGYAEHYTKEMAKDPNGQINISIKNPAGKVVATALAGNSTTNLLPLASASQTQDIEVNLLNSTQLVQSDISNTEKGVFLTSQLLVAKEADYKFQYSLEPEKYSKICDGASSTLYCLDCTYDLEISLTDECGNEMFMDKPNSAANPVASAIKRTIGPNTTETLNGTCSESTTSYLTANDSRLSQNSSEYLTVHLVPGEYTIRRNLTINENALKYYRDNYLEKMACKTLTQFENEELAKVSAEGCNPCDDYNTYKANQVESKTTYINQKLSANDISIDDPDRSNKIALYGNLFDDMMREAKKVCDGVDDPCMSTKLVLLADVSPLGLYAEKDNSKSGYGKSVFNIGDNSLIPNDLGFSYKDLNYFKDNKGFNTYGVKVPLKDLTPTDLIKNWKNEFAEQLLVLHPEYIRYAFCQLNQSSKEYDSRMLNITSYDDAKAKGFFSISTNGSSVSLANDPFLKSKDEIYSAILYAISNSSPTLRIGFENAINSNVLGVLTPKTTNPLPSNLTLLELTKFIIFCKDKNTTSDITSCISNYTLNDIEACNTNTKDLFWNTFKALYTSVKGKYYQDAFESYKSTVPYLDINTRAIPTSNSNQTINLITQYNAGYPGTDKERFFVSSTATSKAAAISNVTDACKTKCEAYADVWMAKLGNCNFENHPGFANAGLFKDAIKSDLINVCKEGCDEYNPFGATTVRPASTATIRSFTQVLQRWGIYDTEKCSDALISVPKQYATEFTGIITPDEINNVIDRCGTIPNPCLIYGGCNSYTNCGNNNSKLSEMVKPLAEFNQSNCPPNQICRSCQDIKNTYVTFFEKYSLDESDNNFQPFFMDYFNTKLNLESTFEQYITFMNRCLGNEPGTYSDFSLVLEEFRFTYLIYKYDVNGLIVANNSNIESNENLAWTSKNNIRNWMYSSSNSSFTPVKIDYNKYLIALKERNYIPDDMTASSEILLGLSQLQFKFNGSFNFASIQNITTGTRKMVPLKGCACNKLQSLKEAWEAAIANGTTSQSLQDYINSVLGFNVPRAEKVINFCKKAFEHVNPNPVPSYSSTSNFGREEQGYLLREVNLKVPCGICDEPDCIETPPPPPPHDGGTGTSTGTGTSNGNCNNCTPITKKTINICEVIKNYIDSFTLANRIDVLQLFDNTSTGGLLDIFYTYFTTRYLAAENFTPIADKNATSLTEWLKRYLCTCSIVADMCGNSVNTNCTKNCPQPANSYKIPITAPAACANCYVPDKKLLSLQKVLNKLAHIRPADELEVPFCDYGNYIFNKLTLGKFDYNLYVPEFYNNTALYNPTVSYSSFVNHVAHTNSDIGFTELLELKIDDNHGFVRNVSLSMDLDFSVRSGFELVTKFYNIKPFYPSNSCGSTKMFSGMVEIKSYNEDCEEVTLQIPITGTYQEELTKTINCNVKNLRMCKEIPNPCAKMKTYTAKANARIAYQQYIEQLFKDETQKYINQCLSSANSLKEMFKMKYIDNQYHYTLYHYDLAGNLIKTVPPAGVKPLSVAETKNIDIKRRSNSSLSIVNPTHKYQTTYEYNTLNQLVKQNTPDAGESNFIYDKVGRMVLSQNAKQKDASNLSTPKHLYSYTIYDPLGRIIETGELNNSQITSSVIFSNPQLIEQENPTNYLLENIVNYTNKTEITRTYYDDDPQNNVHGFDLQNLRSRVATVAYFNSYSNSIANADHSVLYSYDIQGNVKRIVRYVKGLIPIDQQYKTVDYKFDVISGKVEKVFYQANAADQYIHHYKYDAENRLVESYSAPRIELIDQRNNSSLAKKVGLDAAYSYYYHGPLARTELGELQVQGLDYAYTLQGWLKGVNSSSLSASNDMGKDGLVDNNLPSNSNSNAVFPKDEIGFTLNYYDNDYAQIQNLSATTAASYISTNKFSGSLSSTNSGFSSFAKQLYNGNISYMITSIRKLMNSNQPLVSAYQYDQLNRIIEAKYFNQTNSTTPTISATNEWNNVFSYDANGNILTQMRKGSGANLDMDNLQYYYQGYDAAGNPITFKYNSSGNTVDVSNYPIVVADFTNKLVKVTDAVASSNYADDIDNQTNAINYTYDKIGNLTSDLAEDIEKIEWTLYGKIKSIKRISGSTKPDLEFEYTPDGHRAVKIVKPKESGAANIYTYYVRDAQGNILATYTRTIKKTVDFDNLRYDQVNSQIVNTTSEESFAWFISNIHTSEGLVSTGLNNAMFNSIMSSNSISNDFILNSNLNPYEFLIHANNSDLANSVLANVPNDFFVQTMSDYGIIDFAQLCSCMQSRKQANGSFLSLQEYVLSNVIIRNAFLTALSNSNNTAYSSLITDLSISSSGNVMDDLNKISDYISQHGGIDDLLVSLNNSINFSDCNSDFVNILSDLFYSDTDFLNAIGNIPEFKELFYHTGYGSANFTCDLQQAIDKNYLLYVLSYSNPRLMMQLALDYSSKDYIIDWYKDYDLFDFLYSGTLINRSAITAYQDNLTHKLYSQTGNGMENYFELIKTQYGTSFYDQLVDHFLEFSNLYIDSLNLSEWHIYGSSRLGIYQANIAIANRKVRDIDGNSQIATSEYNSTGNYPTSISYLSFSSFAQMRGCKRYELSNHLGNVLAVVSDKKSLCYNVQAYASNFKDNTIGGWTGGWSASGSGWPNFSGPYSSVSNDNGRLKTTATATFGGNRYVINTISGKEYRFTFDIDMSNTPAIYVNARATNGSSVYTGDNLAQLFVSSNGTNTFTFTAITNTTQLLFEKATYGQSSFYIDNVIVEETSNSTSNYYFADVIDASDYSPFGAPLANRSYTAPNSDYRFHFNGKENDNETYGTGNEQDYGFRIYNNRLGKFLSVDPLTKQYPELTPYQFASNTPIWAIDRDGLEKVIYTVSYANGNWEVTKLELAKAGPLGNGALVKVGSNFFYGNEMPPGTTGRDFTRAYEEKKVDASGNHLAYQIPGEDFTTIGYGHAAQSSVDRQKYKLGTKINEAEATELFNGDYSKRELTEFNGFDEFQLSAMSDMSYNSGSAPSSEINRFNKTKDHPTNYFFKNRGMANQGIRGVQGRRVADYILFNDKKSFKLDFSKPAQSNWKKVYEQSTTPKEEKKDE